MYPTEGSGAAFGAPMLAGGQGFIKQRFVLGTRLEHAHASMCVTRFVKQQKLAG